MAITKASAAYLENLTTYKMSDLLNQASLVMVPSGYKEDTVYSVVPSDGSGDMAFTRASNGTRINSAGLVEDVAWNLAQQSETFDNAFWAKYSCTITANTTETTAPNGTNFADILVSANATATSTIGGNIPYINGGQYTVSIFAKYKNTAFIQMLAPSFVTTDFVNFNIQTGAIVGGSYSQTATITSVGNGWYRCSFTYVSNYTGTTEIAPILLIDSASATRGQAFTGDGVKGAYIYGAQANIGSTAKPYFPTTDRLNVPRLTYQNGGGGCPSLLLEKQSTNNVLYSEDFSQANWSKASAGTGSAPVVTTNYATSPDGTQNADLVVFDRGAGNTSSDFSWLYQSFVTASATYTMTCYVKAATSGDVGKNLSWRNFGTGDAWSVNLTNEWQRISVQETGTGSSAEVGFYNRGGYSTGNSVSVLMWGFQAEQSSYETSYIPTTSSSATRVADECSKTGITSLIGQTEGVLFVDFVFTAFDGSAKWIAFLGGGANYIGLYANSNTYIIGEVSNTTSQFSGAYSFSVGQRYKIAIAYKANDFAYYVNGSQITTSSSGTVPTTSDFTFLYSTTNDRIGGKVYNQAVLFKTRLTNAELASLTTI